MIWENTDKKYHQNKVTDGIGHALRNKLTSKFSLCNTGAFHPRKLNAPPPINEMEGKLSKKFSQLILINARSNMNDQTESERALTSINSEDEMDDILDIKKKPAIKLPEIKIELMKSSKFKKAAFKKHPAATA